MKLFIVFVFVFCYITATHGLYEQCQGGKSIENIEEQVKVGGCNQKYCRLKKKTSVPLEMKFTTDKEIKSLVTTVTANIAGIPFPFIGVDGASACDSIYNSDGETKAACPLKAKTDYVYRTNINVLEIYPRVKTVVHWGLTAPDGNDVVCFEVPARIVN